MKYKNSILWSVALLLHMLESAAIMHLAVPNLRSQFSVLALYVCLGGVGFVASIHVAPVAMWERRNIRANLGREKE